MVDYFMVSIYPSSLLDGNVTQELPEIKIDILKESSAEKRDRLQEYLTVNEAILLAYPLREELCDIINRIRDKCSSNHFPKECEDAIAKGPFVPKDPFNCTDKESKETCFAHDLGISTSINASCGMIGILGLCEFTVHIQSI